MGLGKTRTAAYASTMTMARPGHTVILCPAAAQDRWIEDWNLIRPGERLPRITSYDKMVRGPAEFPADIDLLILDEAHRLKNATSKRTKIVFGVEGLAREAEQVFLLSGTPMPNHPGELYTALVACWPEVLKERDIRSYDGFLNYFVAWWQGEYAPVVKHFLPGKGDEFKAMLAPIMLRRTWESPEVLAEMQQMPQILWRHETVTGAATLHDNIGATAFDRMMEQVERGEVPDDHLMTYRRAIGLVKAPAVASLLTAELTEEPQRKMVVMAYHTEVLDLLERHFDAFGVVRMDGATPPALRSHAVNSFQTDPAIRVFLGQITACKESLTLTAASQVEIVEALFSPEDNCQAGARIRRHGQTSLHLTARIWSLAQSFDQPLMQLLTRKTEVLQEAYG